MRSMVLRDGVVVAVGLALAATLFLGCLRLAGAWGGGDAVEVRALLPTTSALTNGARVTMSGVPVGRVTDVKRDGVGTLVTMQVHDHGVLPLPSDSRVTLRQRTPIGENYVEIAPGRAKTSLGREDVLPIRQSEEYVDVDQLLTVFKGRSRTQLQSMLRNTGGALRDRGAGLGQTLGDGAQVVRSGGSIFALLNRDRERIAHLVDQYGRLSAAVGERGAAIRVLAQRGTVALHEVGRRDTDVAALVRELPATLAQVRSSAGRLQRTSQVATPALRQATDVVRRLDPAIAHLRPASQQARNAVAELDRTVIPLRQVLRQVRTSAPALTSALPSVRGTICQLAPAIRYAQPYAKDLMAPVIGLGSASNSYDALGHLVRLSGTVNENSLVGAPANVSQAAYTLIRAGILGKTTSLTWDPYPAPDQEGKVTAKDKPTVVGPDDYPKTGYKYPHITADC